MRLLIIVALSVAQAQAFKLDGGDGEKVCTLERSATNGDNCFYEPECENVCNNVETTVSWNILNILEKAYCLFRSAMM